MPTQITVTAGYPTFPDTDSFYSPTRSLRQNIQDMLDHSKSGLPFKMITDEEVATYFKALVCALTVNWALVLYHPGR